MRDDRSGGRLPSTHVENRVSAGELDDRNRQVLQAVLFEYTVTAQPVGSRQVAKKGGGCRSKRLSGTVRDRGRARTFP